MNKLQILYRDPYLLAVSKPPRVASTGGPGIPHEETILYRVERELEKEGVKEKPFLIHRLDFATSGVLLVGLDNSKRAELESIVRHNSKQNPEHNPERYYPGNQHPTIKKYLALVVGSPRLTGIIDYKLPSRTKGELINAKTEYHILKQPHGKFCSLVEAIITTGRKHQIRRHFASIKHPIVMDDDYGDKGFNRKFRLTFRLGRLFLHAKEIVFWHPILQKMVRIEAVIPPDLKLTIKRLDL